MHFFLFNPLYPHHLPSTLRPVSLPPSHFQKVILKQMLVILFPSDYKPRVSPHFPKNDTFPLASRLITIWLQQTIWALGPASPHTLCLGHMSNYFFLKHERLSLSPQYTSVHAVPGGRNAVPSIILLDKFIFPAPAQISSVLWGSPLPNPFLSLWDLSASLSSSTTALHILRPQRLWLDVLAETGPHLYYVRPEH